MICWDRAVVALNLRCGHNFCSDCLEDSAKFNHDSCAVCRDPQPLDPTEVRISTLLSNSTAAPEKYFPNTVFPLADKAETTDCDPSTPLLLTSGSSPVQTPKPILQPAPGSMNADDQENARRELRESSWPMPPGSQSHMPPTVPPPPPPTLPPSAPPPLPPQPSLRLLQKRPDGESAHVIGQNLLLTAGQGLPQHLGFGHGEQSPDSLSTLTPHSMTHLQHHFQQPPGGFGFGFGAAGGAAQRDRSPDSSGDGEPGVRNAWKTRNQDPREVAARLAKEAKTTIMLGNLPSTATTEMVMQAVQYLGFIESVTFSFVPVNTRTGKCKGYGFVDVDRPEEAARLCIAIAGFHFPNSGQKRTQVSVADTQGTFATLWRLRPWTKKNAVIFETSSPPFVRTAESKIGPMTADEAVAYLRPRARGGSSGDRDRG